MLVTGRPRLQPANWLTQLGGEAPFCLPSTLNFVFWWRQPGGVCCSCRTDWQWNHCELPGLPVRLNGDRGKEWIYSLQCKSLNIIPGSGERCIWRTKPLLSYIVPGQARISLLADQDQAGGESCGVISSLRCICKSYNVKVNAEGEIKRLELWEYCLVNDHIRRMSGFVLLRRNVVAQPVMRISVPKIFYKVSIKLCYSNPQADFYTKMFEKLLVVWQSV